METNSKYALSFLTSVSPKEPSLTVGFVPETPYLSSHPLSSLTVTPAWNSLQIVDRSVGRQMEGIGQCVR